MSSNRILGLSATLICAMASLASCSDDDDVLNGCFAAAGASQCETSSTNTGGRGGGPSVGGSGGTTSPTTTAVAGSTGVTIGGATGIGGAVTSTGLSGMGGASTSTPIASTGGGGFTAASAGASAVGGATVAAGAPGQAGMAGNSQQAGAAGTMGVAGAPQKSPLELACEAVCTAQSGLSCAISNCSTECATFGVAVEVPDAYLAMVQCEAQAITTADGYFCSDQNPMVAPGELGPSPKMLANSACRTEICVYTCNEGTFYDATVCDACACPLGC